MKNTIKIFVIALSLASAMLVPGCIGNNGGSETSQTVTPTSVATPAISTPTPAPQDTTTGGSGSISMVQQTTNGRTYPSPSIAGITNGSKRGGQTLGEIGNLH